MALKLLTVAALVALLGAAGARAGTPSLFADVGASDSYAISLKDSTGAAVRHLDAGTYTLVVRDHSSLHNFHLSGPGVDVASDIEAVGDTTFTVSIADGTYFFQCDAHSAYMHGSFTAGAAGTPTPPAKLTASIGPGASFALRRPAALGPGVSAIAVSDRSATDGFRLAGPGVSKATGIAFRGSVTWKVTLRAGRYSFGSLRHPGQRRSFTISTQ